MKSILKITLLTIVILFSSFKTNNEELHSANINTDATITITSPTGGQNYCLHKQRYIEWQTTGATVNTVTIQLMASNGQTIINTIATNVTNSGQFLWNSATVIPGNYLIKISGMSTGMTPRTITGQTGVFTLKNCRKPDLQVGVINIQPQYPGEGERVIFSGNVMNYGEDPVQNPTVTLTLRRPAGLSPLTYTREMEVTLTRNQGITFEKGFRVHEPGIYTAIFTLDPANTVDEMIEYNNDKERTFEVYPLPDLVVYISNGKRPPVGREREIRIVVKNIGNFATTLNGNISLRTYVKQKGVKLYDIPQLDPGETFTVKRKHKWGTAGTKSITAKISYSNNEIKSNNNEVKGSFFVRLPHHDTYSAAPPIKCSTGETFSSWDDIEN